METGRRPRGAPLLPAGRLRRHGDEPLPGPRDGGRAGPATVGCPSAGRATSPPPAPSGQELREGRRQGHPQGDVQDGHLHGGVLHRRPGLRGGRASAHDLVDEFFTGTTSRLGGVGLDELAVEVPRRHEVAHPAQPAAAGPPRPARRAASTSGAVRASTTSSTPRRCSSCSTPPAPSATRSSSSTAPGRRPGRAAWPPCEACSGCAPTTSAPMPLDEVEPVSADRHALRHRRHVLRLDLGRGPRDPGHRHEPHRRQVQHRRGRRGSRPLRGRPQRRPAPLAPSSRWPRAASA